MSRKYKFHNESGAYFISFATVYWLDIFTGQVYFSVLEECIDYYRKKRCGSICVLFYAESCSFNLE